MGIGKEIKKYRKKILAKQKDIAELANVSQTYLSQIEGETRHPSINVLGKICKAMEIPLPVLIFMSMKTEDIPVGKRKGWEIIKPSIEAMLLEFYPQMKNFN